MSDLALIGAVALVTFASRASYLVRRGRPNPPKGAFLDVFPAALFAALAVVGLAAPAGQLDVTPSLAAGAGGIIGAVATNRSLIGTMLFGLAAYWLARLVL